MKQIIITFLFFLTVFSTAYFARKRGRDPIVWFLIGVFFGLLGLMALFLLPKVDKDEAEIEEENVVIPIAENHEFLIKDWFYLNAEHKQQGPISFVDLKKMLETEQIKRSTYVWCEGMPDWKKIEVFGELKDVLEE